jgi:hypothetical protein
MMAKTAVRAKKSTKLDLPEDWVMSGAKPGMYEGGLDPSIKHEGKRCFLLKTKDDKDATGEWATLMIGLEPSEYRGKRLRLSMCVKTESAAWAAPWMRVDNEEDTVSFDNGCKRQIHDSKDWQPWSIILDVPDDSTNIAYGVMLGGAGKVWITEPMLEEVDKDVKLTDCACMSQIAARTKKSKANKRKLTLPKGWTHKVVYRTNAKYDVGIDPTESYNGQKAACINIRDAYAYESVELFQSMSSDGYRGKRIRLTVQLKSLKVKRGVFLVEIFGPHHGTVALDDMSNRVLEGTHDWTERSFVLDVPENAFEIKFGAKVTGGGVMWFSDLSFEEVDTTVPLTDDYSLGCRGIWWTNLINTDFSEIEEAQYRSQSCKLGQTAKGWLGWSDPGLTFEVGIDSSTRRVDKNSGCIKKLAAGTASDNALLFQKFDGKVYRGKRVRLTAFLKTVGVSGQCGMVLLVMDAHQSDLFSQNTFDIDSDAEHDWLKREIVLDVPIHAGVLMVSLELTGEGSAWINDVAFEVVGMDVPLTKSSWKATPKNLDLMEV